MPEESELNALAERRRLLLLEADLHRNLIGLERENLRTRLAELNATRQRVARNPLLVAATATAGFLTLRNWRKISRLAPAALTAIRWWQAIRRR